MLASRVVLAVALIATGMSAGCTENLDAYSADFGAVLRGEKNFTELVDKIATQEFLPSAKIVIEKVETRTERPGEFRRSVEADRGYLFYYVTVRVINNGTMDLPVSTWQFSAIDQDESEVNAKTTIPHHDFDGSRLRSGAQRVGTLIFEMREGTEVVAVAWDGTIAKARGGWADPNAEAPDDGRPPTGDGSSGHAAA